MMRLASAKRKESEIENAENFISRLEFEDGIHSIRERDKAGKTHDASYDGIPMTVLLSWHSFH